MDGFGKTKLVRIIEGNIDFLSSRSISPPLHNIALTEMAIAVAYYGPDNKTASQVAVGIILEEAAEAE